MHVDGDRNEGRAIQRCSNRHDAPTASTRWDAHKCDFLTHVPRWHVVRIGMLRLLRAVQWQGQSEYTLARNAEKHYGKRSKRPTDSS